MPNRIGRDDEVRRLQLSSRIRSTWVASDFHDDDEVYAPQTALSKKFTKLAEKLPHQSIVPAIHHQN